MTFLCGYDLMRRLVAAISKKSRFFTMVGIASPLEMTVRDYLGEWFL
jgi:hypothetical protein